MSETLTQTLAVSYHEGGEGSPGRAGMAGSAYLTYSAGTVDPDAPVPEIVFKRIGHWGTVQACIDRVRRELEGLVWLALYGKRRSDDGLGDAARELARHVLPERGFARLLSPGFHPQFDVIGDFAARIPWEVLEESYLECPTCEARPVPAADRRPDRFCARDATELRSGRSHLARDHRLSHLPRGDGGRGSDGSEFLIVGDPGEDLCSPERDPDGACGRHLSEVRSIMMDRGFRVLRLQGPNATVEAVRAMLSRPSLAGIYYFGHGYFPEKGTEGCLVLRDGSLWSREIKALAPSARFVFLNACEGAASGDAWALDQRYCSLAEAFARGGGKVVVAPLFPVVNRQAAESALSFFNEAVGPESLGHALQEVRDQSFARYEEGEPHISWLAYRFFGDPDQRLPIPVAPAADELPETGVDAPDLLFDDEGILQLERFSFGIRSVLRRAAARRHRQERRTLSFGDFMAGLARKGDLTRLLLRRLEIDPDDLYVALHEFVETEDEEPPADDADRLRIRNRSEVAPELVEVLTRADRRARSRSGGDGNLICEEDVLDECRRAEAWADLPGLPSDLELRLEADRDQIDGNGHLVLDRLDERAREIIETAHVLAQQRGALPVSHRLLLAAFLIEEKELTARSVQAVGGQPDELLQLMLAASPEGKSRSFGLSREACNRVVLPTLLLAGEIAADRNRVTEADLLEAFVSVSTSAFKDNLLSPPFAVDLEAVVMVARDRTGDSDSAHLTAVAWEQLMPTPGHDADPILAAAFDASAREVIGHAVALGVPMKLELLQSPVLFAALVDSRCDSMARLLGKVKVSDSRARRLALGCIRDREHESARAGLPVLSPYVHEILDRARRLAPSEGRDRATVDDLCRSFFADGGGLVGSLLRRYVEQRREAKSSKKTPAATAAETRSPLLSTLGRDLTDLARRGKLSPVVGREKEIDTALQTLLLSASANPLLVGEAGVGKTAIVEGLAQRIASDRCPERLNGARVIELSLGSLVADTGNRGDFEKRIQQLLAEAGGDVILFIDEIHGMVGAGGGGRSGLDAANLLKSALSRGEIRIIGATTPVEYRRSISRDEALDRRFQLQRIDPPSREATLEVLGSLQAGLERHHAVAIESSAMVAATDLSGRYLSDKQWPAKARDLLDRACALATTEEPGGQVSVRADHAVRVVHRQTGIPCEALTAAMEDTLDDLEERLAGRIVGQGPALRVVADVLRRGRRGLGDVNRPWGVFLLTGRPGVGKTELAKALAEVVYGGPDGLIRFDMESFSQPHSVAKLLGAPPSYIGYGEGSALVESLRRRPFSLLLFDEIEHAHPDVIASLLRLMSEGTIEDAEGHLGDARNTVIVMTSNVLDPERAAPVGFGENGLAPASSSDLRGRLEKFLPRKVIDRVDEVLCLQSLTEDDLATIAARRIEEFARPLVEGRGHGIDVDSEVARRLAAQAMDEGGGARAVIRAVESRILGPLGDLLPTLQSGDSTTIHIGLKGKENEVTIEATSGG